MQLNVKNVSDSGNFYEIDSWIKGRFWEFGLSQWIIGLDLFDFSPKIFLLYRTVTFKKFRSSLIFFLILFFFTQMLPIHRAKEEGKWLYLFLFHFFTHSQTLTHLQLWIWDDYFLFSIAAHVITIIG